MVRIVLIVAVVAILGAGAYILMQDPPDVVIYCALDNVHAEPILLEFAEQTGLKVTMVFDSEANKTVGLTQALLEEKPNPKCDVFWNNELVNTIRLKNAGVLQPYVSPSAADIGSKWKDADGYWAGFAARARILILNEDGLRQIEPDEAKWPRRTEDLLDPRWKGKITVAKPVTGTTMSHMSILWAVKGPGFVESYWAGLLANDVRMAPSNGQTMRLVRDGSFLFGWTDTDDFQAALDHGAPVRCEFPDQEPGGQVTGTIVIPNSVALVKNCPHPENGKKLIDWILSTTVEEKLARGSSAQMPVRGLDLVPRPDYVMSAEDLVTMDVDWDAAAAAVAPFDSWFKEYLNR